MTKKSKIKKIHFIGIGGIGVSALARYFFEKGYHVSGSDLVDSEILEELRSLGIEIYLGHKKNNLSEKTDLVVYSNAISSDNVELQRARKLGVKTLSYPQALGKLTKKHYTIAVCGAHGKGTTTAFVSLILIKAGLDPTVIVGTKLKEFNGSNCRIGKSKFLIVEADEYKRAFLNYWPKIIVLTNIDREHLDYFKSENDIKLAFNQFINHLPGQKGFLVINKNPLLFEESSYRDFLKIKKKIKILTFSLDDPEAKKIKQLLQIPGEHNILNALASLRVAQILKISPSLAFKAIQQYQGAWRRFEIKKIKLNGKKVIMISDYAHHPTEIKATLKSAKEKFKNKKIWVVFQPHQYQRTYYLFKEFIDAFAEADKIIFTEIYSVAGREDPQIVKKIKARNLVEEIKKKKKEVYLIKEFSQIIKLLKKKIKNNEIILIMGAGNIYQLAKAFDS
jgi:UDP-N-acetylmuramate--alanine ligase